jgi:hypothetical protein
MSEDDSKYELPDEVGVLRVCVVVTEFKEAEVTSVNSIEVLVVPD